MKTQITKNDIFKKLTENASLEYDEYYKKMCYYLHYDEDTDTLKDSYKDGTETFKSYISFDYYDENAVEDDMDMQYYYDHEKEDDEKFMAIVDDLYEQLIKHTNSI